MADKEQPARPLAGRVSLLAEESLFANQDNRLNHEGILRPLLQPTHALQRSHSDRFAISTFYGFAHSSSISLLQRIPPRRDDWFVGMI